MYQRQTNSLAVARDTGINLWDEWNLGDNTIGQRYGATIKRYDLMDKLLHNLKYDPFGRRHIINMYQYSDLEETNGLFPCAFETMWSVRRIDSDFYLDLTLNQRSSDYIVANFINKTQYVALQMMVASHLGYKVGKFCHFVQNLHIYDRHFDAANEILTKEPLSIQPKIELNINRSFYDFRVEDFLIKNTEGITKIKSNLELGI